MARRPLCKTVNTVRTSAVLVVQSTLESVAKVRLFVCFYCHKSVIALWSYVNGSMHGFLVKLTDLKWKEFISHGKERSRKHNKRVTEFAIKQQGLQVIKQWDLSRRKQEGLQKGKQQRRKRQNLQRKNQQVYNEETITVFCEESSRLTFKNVHFPRRKKT